MPYLLSGRVGGPMSPCNETWETAAGVTMPMHEMSDQHVINAYRRLEEIVENAGDSWDGDEWSPPGTADFTSSMCDLEVEAERRWGPGDGEALIRERLEKGVHGVPLTPPLVGRKS